MTDKYVREVIHSAVSRLEHITELMNPNKTGVPDAAACEQAYWHARFSRDTLLSVENSLKSTSQ